MLFLPAHMKSDFSVNWNPRRLLTVIRFTRNIRKWFLLSGQLPATVSVLTMKYNGDPDFICGHCLLYTSHVNGSDMIEEAVCEHLGIKDGETTEDGLFTLNNVACLGCCSLAPVMMVKSADGEETFGNLTKSSVKKKMCIRDRCLTV